MHRQVLLACLPYLALTVASVVVLVLLVRLCRARPRMGHLRQLHSDQSGAVQSLSFVLTVPLFVVFMLFIVQLSQITIATVAVQYAAFAAARSALVWIPSSYGAEHENQIGSLRPVAGDDPRFQDYEVIAAGSNKFARMHLAAALAIMPACPSRPAAPASGHPATGAVQHAYRLLIGKEAWQSNDRLPQRLANKLDYALANTTVALRVRHRTDLPPLRETYLDPIYPAAPHLPYYELEPVWPLHSGQTRRVDYDIPAYDDEYAPNEIGWQDQLEVTVVHDFALLPGPGRLLARRTGDSDEIAPQVRQANQTYTWRLTATARLSNEGQKSILRFIQRPQ